MMEMLTVIKPGNLALRFVLELCMLAALAYWGFQTGSGTGAKIALAVGAPLVAAIVWGMFVAPAARWRLRGPTLLVVEAAVFGAGALALYAAGHPLLAVVFAAIVIVNRGLILVWGQ